jgi:hypothetical protein
MTVRLGPIGIEARPFLPFFGPDENYRRISLDICDSIRGNTTIARLISYELEAQFRLVQIL